MQTQMKSTIATWRLGAAVGMLVGVLLLAPLAAAQSAAVLGIAKAAQVAAERGSSFLITYDLHVTNLGSSDIQNVVVEDDLGTAFPGTSFEVVGLESKTADVRSDYDGREVVALLRGTDVLAAGKSLDITLIVRVTLSVDEATLSNSAIARGSSGGQVVTDRSQEGVEPDPDWDGDPTNNDVPTVVELVKVSRIGAAKQVTSVTKTADGEYKVVYGIIVENYGQVVLSAVNVQENLGVAFPRPAEVQGIEVRSADFSVNPAFDGVTDVLLLIGTDTLRPGDRGTIALTLDVSTNGGGAWFENVAIASGTAPDGSRVMDLSNTGKDADPDGDGDPANNSRPTDTLLVQTSLSGFVETTARIAALPLSIDVDYALFSNTLRVEDLTMRVDARFTDAGFGLLTCAVSGPLGDASADSTLVLGPSAATLTGTVSPGGLLTTAYFEWGLSAAYGNETEHRLVGSGTSGVAIQETVSGLSPSTTYHCRTVAVNSAGTSYGSDQTFTPTTPYFAWRTSLSLDVLGIDLSNTTYLASPASSSYDVVRLSGATDAFGLVVSTKFGLCSPAFFEATACADWSWGLCETPLNACLSLNGADGFDSFTITATGIPLLASAFEDAVSLDVRIEYAIEKKTVTPTIRFDPDWLICPEVDVLGEVVLSSPNLGISAIRIYGAVFTTQIGDVILRVADSFSDDKNASVTGKTAFFESFSLETPLASCCGSPGRLKGSIYFERSPAPSGGLFGIGRLEGLVDSEISSHLSVSFTTEYEVAVNPAWTFTARLRALW